MLFRRTAFALVPTLAFGLVSACGSKSFDDYESGGGAGKAGSASGSGGSAAATGGDAGSSGSSGSAGRGGTGGSGSGGTGRGGTGTGGTGAGGAGAGSSGGAGGSAGMAAAGAGGSLSGAGGAAAGAGGSVAGAGGCGICPFVACAPPVMVDVTAPGDIAALEGQLVDPTTGTVLGPLQCNPGGTSPCTWNCLFYQVGLGTADYSIVLSAPGYEEKTIDFSVEAPQNCGCCGCLCGIAYSGETALEPDGSGTPACCSSLADTTNCGSCGNKCDTGQTCADGECTEPCLREGASCDGGGACCSGLTCCSGASSPALECNTACVAP